MAQVPVITVPKPNDWPAVFENAHLTTPLRRATAAALVTGIVTWCLKPSIFFDEEGKMRMQRIPYLNTVNLPGLKNDDDEDEKLTNCHFLTVPLLAAAVAGVLL